MQIKGTHWEEVLFSDESELDELRMQYFIEGVFCFKRNEKGPCFKERHIEGIKQLGGVINE